MARKKPKSESGKKAKMKKVMDEFKGGKLRSGSPSGPKVKDRKQAIAIGLSESGQSKKSKSKSTASTPSSGKSAKNRRKTLEGVTF